MSWMMGISFGSARENGPSSPADRSGSRDRAADVLRFPAGSSRTLTRRSRCSCRASVLDLLDAADPRDLFLDGPMICVRLVSGDALGYGIATDTIGGDSETVVFSDQREDAKDHEPHHATVMSGRRMRKVRNNTCLPRRLTFAESNRSPASSCAAPSNRTSPSLTPAASALGLFVVKADGDRDALGLAVAHAGPSDPRAGSRRDRTTGARALQHAPGEESDNSRPPVLGIVTKIGTACDRISHRTQPLDFFARRYPRTSNVTGHPRAHHPLLGGDRCLSACSTGR